MMPNDVAWFYLVWPWVGLGAAIVLTILLFSTDVLRSNKGISRWKDISWLAWLWVVVYLLHNAEEYAIDFAGNLYAFPASMNASLGNAAIPDLSFLSTNVAAMWFAMPICAWLSRKHPIAGLTTTGMVFVNIFIHLMPVVRGGGYNPGLGTAILMFLPLCLWCFHQFFGSAQGKFSLKTLGIIIANGVVIHILLIGSMLLYAQVGYPEWILVGWQWCIAAMLVGFAWMMAKRTSTTQD